MALPPLLQAGIDGELERADWTRVAKAAEQITADYKAGNFGRPLGSAESRVAYLITRMPATYAANVAVFREAARLCTELRPLSLLDLGAGPGTAAWAAAEVWQSLAEITLVEANREMVAMGQRLGVEHQVLSRAKWINEDVSARKFPSADVVMLSYAIGELRDAASVAKAAWNAARKLLVVIEPGTPKNFQNVAEIRRKLIAGGAKVAAPCPHENECPMWVAEEWCHFAARLERTKEHRRLKCGALGHEDEKYSYVAFAKDPVRNAESRVVRHPQTFSGHIRLNLCTPEGLNEKTVTKSQKERFRAARRVKWGDEWSL